MTTLVPPRRPLAITRAVVFAMVLREMRVRFSSRRLGGLWTLAEPLLHLALIMLLYSTIRQRSIPGMDLPVFLLFGLVPFLLFRNISLTMMDALEANRALFAYRQIQLLDAWLARFVVNFCISASVLLLMAFALAFWGGYDLHIAEPLYWVLAWVVGLALAFGLGMIYCVLGEVAPEWKTVIRLMHLPLYLISGVIFPLRQLPPALLDWLALNPWLHVIELLRVYASPAYRGVPQVNLAYPAAWAVVALCAGLALYRVRRLQMMAV